MEKLQTTLRSLRLSGLASALPSRYAMAKTQEIDYLAFLEVLVEDEMAKRKDTLLSRRIKLAQFPFLATLDDFNFAFNPEIQKRSIQELASSRFVHQNESALLIGPPGTGKTHIAIALGMLAIENGYTVFYRSAFDLVEEMQEAFRTDTRKKYVHGLTRHQLLIVDELGMKKKPPNAADDLLEVIHRRYGNSATLIATNRPVEDWGKILGDTAATSAILDRFLQQGADPPLQRQKLPPEPA
ncbi:MAG: IS21-like element helper ATPase IstB [Fibrobacterota bacterium]|nr:IS21-like element helper ATPase IstB [Fibrobacterota bacterium]